MTDFQEPHRRRVGRGRAADANINPSNTNDIVGTTPAPRRPRPSDAIAAAKAAFPAWSRSDPAGALRDPEEGVGRDPGPQGGARPAAVARGGQDACRRHRRGDARRPDLRLLRRRGAAPRRRAAASRAARHRGDDHARAGRRRRHDHAVEFPDRHPGLEDRAGARLRQHGGVQAGRPRAGLRLGARRHPRTAPACPRACFNLVMGRGSVVGQAILEHPGRQRDLLHRLGRDRPQGAPRPASADRMRRFQLEMGGKNPLVVLDDADLKTAVECAVNGAFFSTGQRCTASSRLIVTRRHPRQVRRRPDRAPEGPRRRRRAEGRHAYRPGRRPEPARPGPEVHQHRPRTRAPSWPGAASC